MVHAHLNDMANKNTKRLRRSMEKTRKFGVAINTSNGDKWNGQRIDRQSEVVAEIRAISKRLYGASA
jgi:hypothetical protein